GRWVRTWSGQRIPARRTQRGSWRTEQRASWQGFLSHWSGHQRPLFPLSSRAARSDAGDWKKFVGLTSAQGGGGAKAPGLTEPMSQSRNSAIFGMSAVAMGATM